jgi:hypothetical protein
VSPSSTHRIRCKGRTQRNVPSPPAHGFLPRQLADELGQKVRQDVRRRSPLALDGHEPELALAGGAFLALIQRHPVGVEESFDGFLRRVGARAALLFRHVGLGVGQTVHHKGEPARRRENMNLLMREAGCRQRLVRKLLQIFHGAPLHAGGDFLGKQFEQKLGHGYAPAAGVACRLASQASQQPLASARTRPI